MAALTAVVLAVGGGTAMAVGLTAQVAPPSPPAGLAAGSIPAPHPSASSPAPKQSPTLQAAARPTKQRHSLVPSAPVSIDIPSIQVHSPLVRLGLNSNNTVQVPADYLKAGWYDGSPTPGAMGAAVILGHIDSSQGLGVFFRLADLRPGNTIIVHRRAGVAASFRVDAIREYPKDHFPAADVYGYVDYAGLRLISCGGTFDQSSGGYQDNIVVYAHLTNPPRGAAGKARAGPSGRPARPTEPRSG